MTKKILRPSTLGWPDDWTMETVGMSQSLWDMWLSCNRSFLFHINGYSPSMREEKVHFGNLCHYVCDKTLLLTSPPTSRRVGKLVDEYTERRIKENTLMTAQQMEMDAAKAHAVMTVYFEQYAKDLTNKKFTGVERGFKERYSGCVQRGKIDADFLSNRKKWLMEHKTKGRINETDILRHLSIDFQNLFYLLNDEIRTGTMAVGTLYDVIRNPQLKLGKNESVKSYYKRILETCRADPDHSFKRWEAPYGPKDHEMFSTELDRHIGDLKHKTGLDVCPNRFNCTSRIWTCDFHEACSTDSMASLTKSTEPQMDYIFPELKEVKIGGNKNKTETVGQRKKVTRRKVARRRVAKRK